MIFANRDLAQRLEQAEGRACREFAMARAQLFPEAGAAWIKCAGAYVVYDGIDSPVTQTFGLGLFEELTSNQLDEIERFFFDRGASAVHEVCPLAGVATLDMLCARGYRPVELSSVLYQPLSQTDQGTPTASTGSIRVRVAAEKDAAMWASVSAQGWSADYPELLESIQQFGALASARDHSVSFLAELDGRPGATGALSIHEEVALFGGASTIPEMRHRGLQRALLDARMAYASEQKCDLAMMVTEAGSQSQRNAERVGFRIAYTRTKWRLLLPGQS
jgi:GNAT superfamily N-acetyltransferase